MAIKFKSETELIQNLTKILLEWVLRSTDCLLNDIMDESDFSSLSSIEVLANSFSSVIALLYRLLLVFYAETVRLLPLEHPLYYQWSLTNIFTSPKRKSTNKSIYQQLSALFDLINYGSKELPLAPYPGRFFQSDFQPLLPEWRIKDTTLYQIFKLCQNDAFLDLPQNKFFELIVRLHAKLLDYQPYFSKSSRTIKIRHRKKLRHTRGTFYTPKIVGEYIVSKTLAPLVQGKSPKEILSLRILDPTMGCGIFLLEACSFLAQAYHKASASEGGSESLASSYKCIMENCLFGIDLDPLAVELTKFAFWMTVGPDQFLNPNNLNQHLITGDCFLSTDLHLFDAVIVNPPYVDVNKKDYEFLNFKTLSCRNLYPYILEKSLQLIKEGGKIGAIIPISITCARRMQPLRDLLHKTCSELWIASFGIRPSKVFPGVDQRVAIITLTKKQNFPLQIYTTKFLRWKKNQLPTLLTHLRYENSSGYLLEGRIPRLGNTQMKALLESLLKSKYRIKDFLALRDGTSPYHIYYHNVARYWIKATDFNPYFKRNGQRGTSSNMRILSFPDEESKNIIGCILNSSLFFLFWQMYSDDFHVTLFEIKNFPLNPERLSQMQHQQLGQLFNQLMVNRKKHSFIKKLKNGIEYQEFQPGHAQEIIQQIDKILLQMYNLEFSVFVQLIKPVWLINDQ
ncbi:MAG: Eco57I restriction-modification methylase domain-containing protein [Promethearchaeota archaeon]